MDLGDDNNEHILAYLIAKDIFKRHGCRDYIEIYIRTKLTAFFYDLISIFLRRQQPVMLTNVDQ